MATNCFYIVFVAILASVCCEPAHFRSECNNETQCTVDEVNVTPCAKPRMCQLRPGENATIAFKFTPKFASNNFQQVLAWRKGSTEELPFADLNSNACLFTTCPLEPEKQQDFLYTLYIWKKFPIGSYPLRWKLYDGDDKTKSCCFDFRIQIRK